MMIDIVKDGKTDYRIVRRDAATGNDAGRMSAIKLKQAIKAATGCDIELTTDWTPDEDGKAYEILVGKVDRPAHEQIPKDLAKDEFVILFVENKILIDGGSESAITNGVDYFTFYWFFCAIFARYLPNVFTESLSNENPGYRCKRFYRQLYCRGGSQTGV